MVMMMMTMVRMRMRMTGGCCICKDPAQIRNVQSGTAAAVEHGCLCLAWRTIAPAPSCPAEPAAQCSGEEADSPVGRCGNDR
eukprot:3394405-Karenia_brevis.AAC.1